MQISGLSDGGFRPGERIQGVVHLLFVHYQESSTPARSTNDSSQRKDMFPGIPMVKLLPVEPKRGLEETEETRERPEAQGELRPSGELDLDAAECASNVAIPGGFWTRSANEGTELVEPDEDSTGALGKD